MHCEIVHIGRLAWCGSLYSQTRYHPLPSTVHVRIAMCVLGTHSGVVIYLKSLQPKCVIFSPTCIFSPRPNTSKFGLFKCARFWKAITQSENRTSFASHGWFCTRPSIVFPVPVAECLNAITRSENCHKSARRYFAHRTGPLEHRMRPALDGWISLCDGMPYIKRPFDGSYSFRLVLLVVIF